MADKKTERLDVRISHEKKQAFNEACDIQSDTPSHAVRRFVNSYIRRAKRDENRSHLNAVLPRHTGKIAAALAIGLTAAVIIKPLFAVSSDELFAFYDYDKSGIIEIGEILPNDHHLHRVLNIDGKAGISRDEFISKSVMSWEFVDPNITYDVITEKTKWGMRVTKSTSSIAIDNLPEGTLLSIKNSDGELISLEEFKAKKMNAFDLKSLDYEDMRSMETAAPSKSETDPKYRSKFVTFDLTNMARPFINVLEITNTSGYSKSMPFSRNVDWVEGAKTPQFVMGNGAKKAVLTASTQPAN